MSTDPGSISPAEEATELALELEDGPTAPVAAGDGGDERVLPFSFAKRHAC